MRLDERYIQPKLKCPRCRKDTEHIIDRNSLNIMAGKVYADYTCFTCGYEHLVLLGDTDHVIAQFHAA